MHLWGNTRRVDDVDRICPHRKKGEVRSFQFDLSMSLVRFLRCRDSLLDSLLLYVYVTVYIYIYMYMFTMVPARCVLDYVWILGFCHWILRSFSLANVLQSFDSYVCPSFVECLLRDLNFMFRDNVLQNPCNAGMV